MGADDGLVFDVDYYALLCLDVAARRGDERMASTILFSIRGEYRIYGCTRKIYWGSIIKTSFLLCGDRIERLNKLF